ncbi:unnamed protein product [Arctia plantaginis]|uniref:FP protein C-terminal domain-containing protein n=1 Tax=Arctia plantaginis TaxID=874455 RepID=A0A8S1A0H5_ARCPL|nr:unnamed protein product [Arctia plantaginis]
MSTQRTPPKLSTTAVGHTQSESDLNALQQCDVSFVNITRNKRPRTELAPSPASDSHGQKHDIMELLTNWKTELDTKLNDMFIKQNTLISKLSTDISELKLQNYKIQKSNDEIVQSMEFINNQYEELKSGLTTLQKERLEQRLCIEKLERNIQDLQLKSRSSSIEIRNVPQVDKETTSDLAKTICVIGDTVGSVITPSDLRDIYRLPSKPGSTRPIVAEFQTVQMKQKTIAAVRDFNNSKKTVEEKLNTGLINISGKRQPVYVADHLPASAKKLFYLSREFAKQNAFKFCWTVNGNVFLRKEEGNKQILISSEQCLHDLRNKL